MSKLVTGREVHGLHSPALHEAWVRQKAMELASHGMGVGASGMLPITDVDQQAPPAIARVDGGEWLADCPGCPYRSCTKLVKGHPFMCAQCVNYAIRCRWRPVLWPTYAMVAAIEAELERRHFAPHQYWWPGETVQKLRIENAAHPEWCEGSPLVIARR